MKNINKLFLAASVVIMLLFLLNTANTQLNIDNTLKAPFISTGNSQHSMQSIMQNSKKDIVFIENLGQIRDSKGNKRPDVLFLSRSQCVDMYITNTGITYVFRKTEGDIKDRDKATDTMPKNDGRQVKTSLYRLDMEFIEMNRNIKVKKELAVEQQFNYYTPEYPNGISPRAYKKITIENIYEGIDLVYYEKEGKMKYDFIVKAGADYREIRLKYKDASSVSLDKDGSVTVTTPMGEIHEEKPFTYLKSRGLKIESGYLVNDKTVEFEIAEYNKSEDIIIDPYRIWATYYGGSDDDWGNSIYTDNLGNLFVTGRTSSTNFPTHTLTGAYNQSTYGGSSDLFILKFTSSSARQWATYYGGSGEDVGYGICTDNSGNIYITGSTVSSNFPTKTLPGAYNQSIYGGGNIDGGDAFILKFNNSGVRLWATYYGGSGSEGGSSICTDNSGNLFITGETGSLNFPIQTLSGAYNQTTKGGGYDVFILKFNSNGSRLWATYYGGYTEDKGYSVCTDYFGNLFITGMTGHGFPIQTLSGAYNQTTPYGVPDAFILKFNNNCERIWATYYGGTYFDCGEGVCTDNSGNLFITGWTWGSYFPLKTLLGAYNQTTIGGYGTDAFILKFNSNCVRMWATYYGGNNNDEGHSICTDDLGNIYVTGETRSNNFPTQSLIGSYNQTSYGGSYEAFILKFNSSCSRIWATYYGGSGGDWGNSICTDNSGNLYITGETSGNNFPIQTLSGAYNQTAYGGGGYEGGDAFILKFNPTVDIKKISSEVPVRYSLHQNYPNPFNPITNIKFDIPKSSFVKMIIYNSLGKEVTKLVNEKLSALIRKFGDVFFMLK